MGSYACRLSASYGACAPCAALQTQRASRFEWSGRRLGACSAQTNEGVYWRQFASWVVASDNLGPGPRCPSCHDDSPRPPSPCAAATQQACGREASQALPHSPGHGGPRREWEGRPMLAWWRTCRGDEAPCGVPPRPAVHAHDRGATPRAHGAHHNTASFERFVRPPAQTVQDRLAARGVPPCRLFACCLPRCASCCRQQ